MCHGTAPHVQGPSSVHSVALSWPAKYLYLIYVIFAAQLSTLPDRDTLAALQVVMLCLSANGPIRCGWPKHLLAASSLVERASSLARGTCCKICSQRKQARTKISQVCGHAEA